MSDVPATTGPLTGWRPPNLREQTADLLFQCQFIEWLLRDYLTHINTAADTLLRNKGVRFKGYELRRKPLGYLVRLFARHSDRDDLVASLDAFKTRRNDVIHDAFMQLYGRGTDDKQSLHAIVDALCTDANSIISALLVEVRKVGELTIDPRLYTFGRDTAAR